MPLPRQPFLHELVTVLAAPTQVWSDRTGAISQPADRGGVQGVMHADVRVLSEVSVTVDARTAIHLATELAGRHGRFSSLLRHVGEGMATHPDPQVRMDRTREVEPGQVNESLVLSSVLADPVKATIRVSFTSDLAPMEVIKEGSPIRLRCWDTPAGSTVHWGLDGVVAQLEAPGSTWSLDQADQQLVASWPVVIPARGEVTVEWQLTITDDQAAVTASTAARLPRTIRADGDYRLPAWLARSLDDLDNLTMSTPTGPGDTFLAAGAPWYLTLFGRDSIWSARMVLPVALDPARGTLRTLARLQGTTNDVESAEQPGKIMHELRRGQFTYGDTSLPPLYYGTIDATPLWICLLHDAWRAGLAETEVRTLLPGLRAALSWLTDYGDADGDGFLEYLDTSGHGLANQGWKDSSDSVRFHDGTIATGPVALCEVQGYAYEAATSGAVILDAFGEPGAEDLREWAAALATRFRAEFWCGTGAERFPALALDGDKRRVDSLTSNIGHLLGTGMLNAEEELTVARLVSGPELDSGLGLRTMAPRDAGYSPLSYHCGSVWPHDTAIVIDGLVRAGLVEHAGGLIEGLLRASVAFEQRLPELWSGEGRPVPYPASCRPQAWSAAAAVVVARALERS